MMRRETPTPAWRTTVVAAAFALGIGAPRIALAQETTAAPPGGSYAPPAELADARPEVRAAAVRKLVAAGEARAIVKIASMARKDPDPRVRTAAAWAVGEMDLRMRKALLRSVSAEDASAEVRDAASKALGRLGSTPSVPFPQGPAPTAPPEPNAPAAGARAPWIMGCADLPPPSAGFARGAGVFGYLAAGGVGALYVSAALTRERLVPAIPLAAAGTGLTVITAVVVGAGSKSARDRPGLRGSVGLRLFGWLTFGFHIVGSAVLAGAVPFHWIKEDDQGNGWTPPIGWIIANGATAIVALIALSAESLISAREARDFVEERGRRDRDRALSVVPFVAPYAPGNAGSSGAVIGVAGTL
jgi:hypothetical protein